MTAVLALPRLAIDVAGARVAGADYARIVGCHVRQAAGAPDQGEVTFLGRAPDGLEPGQALRIGVDSSSIPLFVGTVTGIEHVLGADGSLTIRVRGYDALHQLRVSGSVKAWTDCTAASIARQVGGAAGLSVDSASDGPTLRRVIQRGEPDLDLVAQLAERAGLAMSARDGTLHLYRPEDGIGSPVSLTWGAGLREASIDESPTAGPRPAQVQGQDVTRGEPLDFDASDGDGPTLQVPGASVRGQGEPEALARAEQARQAGASWVLRGIAEGDPQLRPGTMVSLETPGGPRGLARLARSFVLTEVQHDFDDAAGFVSTLSSAPRPRAASRATGAMLSLGTVLQVDDPDGAGRVVVTLDAYGDVETEWLPVLTPAASGSSGLIVQPDVGDHVLVLGSGIDPGWGVVLGGLYMDKLPDDVVDGGRSRRQIWRTSGGHRISLDDVANTVTLTDNAGSTVRLEPGLVTLSSIGDLHLTAAGKAVVITGATVDFVQG